MIIIPKWKHKSIKKENMLEDIVADSLGIMSFFCFWF